MSEKKVEDYTFEDCLNHPVGHVYAKWDNGRYSFLVIRGHSCLLAYFGVGRDHNWYGKSYQMLERLGFPEVHGGLTFSDGGDDDMRPKDKWWFGWDYAHYGDKIFSITRMSVPKQRDEHFWTPAEVIEELRRIEDYLIARDKRIGN